MDVFKICCGDQEWEYKDGWAYRKSETGPDGSTFEAGNWKYSGVDALDSQATNPDSSSGGWPIKSYCPSEDCVGGKCNINDKVDA